MVYTQQELYIMLMRQRGKQRQRGKRQQRQRVRQRRHGKQRRKQHVRQQHCGKQRHYGKQMPRGKQRQQQHGKQRPRGKQRQMHCEKQHGYVRGMRNEQQNGTPCEREYEMQNERNGILPFIYISYKKILTLIKNPLITPYSIYFWPPHFIPLFYIVNCPKYLRPRQWNITTVFI